MARRIYNEPRFPERLNDDKAGDAHRLGYADDWQVELLLPHRQWATLNNPYGAGNMPGIRDHEPSRGAANSRRRYKSIRFNSRKRTASQLYA